MLPAFLPPSPLAARPLTLSRPSPFPPRVAPPPPASSRPRLRPTAVASARPNPISILLAALPAIFSPTPTHALPTPTSTPPVIPISTTTTTTTSRSVRFARLRPATAIAVRPVLAQQSSTSTPPISSDPSTAGVPNVPSDPPSPPPPVSLPDRLAFYLSEFLMWNPGARVLALFVFTLAAMYLGSFLYRFADPNRAEAEYPFWHAVRAIANPLEDDWTKNSLRATSIILASVGMVVFAILIGMVTESVESAVQQADGETSTVVVSDHILVCGWGSHVSQIIKDVNSVSSNLKVVILASPEQKANMMNEIRTTLSDAERKSLRIFYRPGAPIIANDLDRVAASRARKILLVNPRTGDPIDADRVILSQAIALRQNLPSYAGDIVAELNSPRDEGILRSIMHGSHAKSVETVNAELLLFRFMAQAIRQPGLADVVALLMGDESNSVFHVLPAREAAPNLVGTNFADLRPTSVPGSILCGFFDNKGKLFLENGSGATEMSRIVAPDTKMLLLGKRRASSKTVQFSTSASKMIHAFRKTHAEDDQGRPETYLVCGWRQDMQFMLQELDTVLPRGSKVTIVDEDAPDSVPVSLKNVAVTTIQKRADRYENLEALLNTKAKPFDHVVVLGSALGDSSDMTTRLGHEEDSMTLATLVYVNDLLEQQHSHLAEKNGKAPSRTMVTTEFINERVAEMARDQGNVANAILPQNLSAKIAAQTVRDNRLNAVWKELLSQDGREVYLRPCSNYGKISGERMSFATVADSLAKSNDDIVIGYIPRYIPKVKINPQDGERFNTRVWDPKDTLIVLSKE